jgi:pimeloyl-ACP methyl ester carboxylesterase
MLKRLMKLGAWGLLVLLTALVALAIYFSVWLGEYKKQLHAGSNIVMTTRGEVEYATAGEGVPILRIHGSPGGYDHSIASARSRPKSIAGYKIIAVSRPGYLRTPLSSGRTPAEQADLYSALLDELGIERAVVYGVSGGGPSALQFALRHPRRTLGLVLVVPYLKTDPAYTGALVSNNSLILYAQDFSFWIGMKLMSLGAAAHVMPSMIREYDATDPVQLAMMHEIGAGFIPANLRASGRANDITQYGQLGIERWPLETIRVPTLFLHGNEDANAPYEASKRAAARIPTAEFVTLKGADHLMIISRHREISDRVGAFMESVTHEAIDKTVNNVRD